LFVLKDPTQSSHSQSGEEPEEEEGEEIKAERQRLLALMGIESSSSFTEEDEAGAPLAPTSTEWIQNAKDQLKANPFPPLTTIGRERLQVEMDLLRQLETSDEPIRHLWHFWYNSRGRHNTVALVEADRLVHDNNKDPVVVQVGALTSEKTRRLYAERMLRKTIQREGIYWAEPINRLATLLFYQERYQEARDLCEMVLAVKPWHVGCQTGIVEVCDKLGDKEGVEYWLPLRMPPLDESLMKKKSNHDDNNNSKDSPRKQWVDRMLKKAQAMLDRGESGIQESFQAVDDKSAELVEASVEEGGAWE